MQRSALVLHTVIKYHFEIEPYNNRVYFCSKSRVQTEQKFSTVWNTFVLAMASSPTLNWRWRSTSTDRTNIRSTPSSRSSNTHTTAWTSELHARTHQITTFIYWIATAVAFLGTISVRCHMSPRRTICHRYRNVVSSTCRLELRACQQHSKQ